MDYKDTLLMPQTTFSMRGNLPVNEELRRKELEKVNLYQKILEKNKDKKPFVLHDGPPYANGDIHVGHALNKILKDFIVRSKNMAGFYAPFIPGWDTHGLPIESAITKTGVNRKEMTLDAFRKLCHKYAMDQVKRQKEGFKLLNVLGDYENPYITLTKEYEARQIEVFAKMAQKGLIYKGLKPVYWSPTSESALAEAEIEYKDKQDTSIYVSFKVVNKNDFVDIDDNLVIWTTTPWTLPGNLAIAVSSDIEYARISYNNNYYIIASNKVVELTKMFGFNDYEVVGTFLGSSLKDVKYKHVFEERFSPVVFADYVSTETGTGLVHTAPGYGMDDFITGNKYNLGMIVGVNDQGVLTEGEFAGLFYEEANEKIIASLQNAGNLLASQKITHSYPHDWRTKKPVIFRATSQWFCSIEPIRDDILNKINDEIKWLPTWGKTRLNNMIKDRGDWCISRQRVWGVPIPIFYNEDGSEIIDYDIMMHVASLFKEHGSDIWFLKEAKELLPEGYTNSHSPNGNFKKETDIMDVWFDSGSSHTAVLSNYGLSYPADLYLEGSDQYRGWFNSSLITGTAVYNEAPYRQVVSHGFVLDGKGNKMSKSLGNTVDPLKIVKTQGADILRWWVASTDFTDDVRISDELITQVKESYRKLRNTYRFMLGNLADFTYQKDKVAYEDMFVYDKYLMNYLANVTNQIQEYYNEYNFKEIYKTVNNFISLTLSNFYLDFTKDILYIESAASLKRRSVQTVLYNVINDLIVLLAPILPYTSDEVYTLIHGQDTCVHLEDFSKRDKYSDSKEVMKTFESFFELKDDVYKALEILRNDKVIGKSLEAVVYINPKEEYKEMVSKLEGYLAQLLIVSNVKVDTSIDSYEYDSAYIKIEASSGNRCERCWNYFDEDLVDGLCPRCLNVISSKEK